MVTANKHQADLVPDYEKVKVNLQIETESDYEKVKVMAEHRK